MFKYPTIIWIFSLFINVLCASEQIDSIYIKKSDHKLAIRPFLKTDFLSLFEDSDKNKHEISYLTNSPQVIGLGLSINNSIINLSYGYGFNFLKQRGNIKTKSFDFQYHKYARKYVLDLYLQKYKGFYMNSDPIIGYPDLDIRQYGIQMSYIFNNKRYSYKAIFNHDEQQLKSVGSFLIGATINRVEVQSDSIEVFGAHNLIKSTQFGFNGGYTYNWIISKFWIIGASINAGFNIGYENMYNSKKKKYRVYQTALPRLAVGYNKNDWSLGFNYWGNLSLPISSKKPVLGLMSNSVSIYFIKRFNIIPFWDKKDK